MKVMIFNSIKCCLCKHDLQINNDKIKCDICEAEYKSDGSLLNKGKFEKDFIKNIINERFEDNKEKFIHEMNELQIFMDIKAYLIEYYSLIMSSNYNLPSFEDYYDFSDDDFLFYLKEDKVKKIYDKLKENIQNNFDIDGISDDTCPFCILDELLLNDLDNRYIKNESIEIFSIEESFDCVLCAYRVNHNEKRCMEHGSDLYDIVKFYTEDILKLLFSSEIYKHIINKIDEIKGGDDNENIKYVKKYF